MENVINIILDPINRNAALATVTGQIIAAADRCDHEHQAEQGTAYFPL